MSDATHYMREALKLAEKGRGWVSPNPMVGAVIVKNNKVIGQGYHQAFGKDHAEVEALKNIDARGATLYVTLEPCSHHGKTPPCTEAILESGIQKVVIASKDPLRNGIEILKSAGLEIECGVLEDEATALNKAFFLFHEAKRPLVTLKVAMSLDGKIARSKDKASWLTSESAQKKVHQLRHEHQAILVGAGTVLSDNPHLGVRKMKGRDPLRIILGGKRKLPPHAQIFRDERYMIFEDQSVESVLKSLYQANIQSLLVEGGQAVFRSFLEAQKVDQLEIFIAPVYLGVEAVDFYDLQKKLSLSIHFMGQLGPDLWINATPQWDSNKG